MGDRTLTERCDTVLEPVVEQANAAPCIRAAHGRPRRVWIHCGHSEPVGERHRAGEQLADADRHSRGQPGAVRERGLVGSNRWFLRIDSRHGRPPDLGACRVQRAGARLAPRHESIGRHRRDPLWLPTLRAAPGQYEQ